MNIETTLKELLSERRSSLVDNYRSMLTNQKNRASQWIKVADEFVRENLLVESQPEYLDGDTRYTAKLSRNSGTFSAVGDELDEKLFYDLANPYTLEYLRSKHGIQLKDFPAGSYMRDMVHDIFRNVTRVERIEKSTFDSTTTRHWKTDAELDTLAEEMADASLADFVNKMKKKMAAIGEVKNANIDYEWGNLFQTCLNVEFENGIRFNMINSIVFKVSSRGKPFHQFPARFNSVTLNGAPQKGCSSEASVKRLAENLQEA